MATNWIIFKSIIVFTLYISFQLIQPFLPVYTWCVSGFLYYLVAVQTMHEISHGILSQCWWYFLATVGIGGVDWQAKHLKHHKETNDETDPELMVSSVFRLHQSQKLEWYHAWQHIYAWILYCFLHFSIWKDMIIGTPNPWRGARYSKKSNSYRRYVFLFLHVVWPWIVTGYYYSFVYELLAWIIPSLLITVCFQTSHVMEIILVSNCGQWDSVAWCPNSVLVTEITGGLNLQPYHHKYPHLPHSMLPYMRKGKLAPEVDTFTEAIVQHYRALKLLGSTNKKFN